MVPKSLYNWHHECNLTNASKHLMAFGRVQSLRILHSTLVLIGASALVRGPGVVRKELLAWLDGLRRYQAHLRATVPQCHSATAGAFPLAREPTRKQCGRGMRGKAKLCASDDEGVEY